MEDMFGTHIRLADMVVFRPSDSEHLVVGEVVRFSLGRVSVDYSEAGRPKSAATFMWPYDLVVRKA